MLRMHFRNLPDGSARYAVAPHHRWIYGLFSLLMGIGFLSVLRDGSFSGASLFPLALLLVSLAGLGYRESWVFDPAQRTISYGLGCYVLFKRDRLSAEDVQRVEITHFVRGRSPAEAHARPRGRNKAMLVFSLRMVDGTTKDIEILPEHSSAGRTEAIAHQVAKLMDLPFHADRERDIIRQVSVRDL